MQAKSWYLSKTLLFNILALVVMVATAFGFGEFKPDTWVVEVGTISILLINIILRLYTSRAIKL